tara:strand:- start:796 stop:1404 length:609 start_codon:yes stop_codon:yes gene_type:complete
MRYITKRNEPQELTEWKNLANDDWQPTYGGLPGDVKQAVYSALLNEQGHICCYCERSLTDNDYHIEHLNPQHLKAGDDLDYSNFLCSCLRSTEKGTPLHCGMLKDGHELSVHPLQPDCQSKFTFTAAGEIDGVDPNAKNTINILGLNIMKLNDMRKEALAPFLDKDLSDQEFHRFVSGYLCQSTDGNFNPFVSAVACLSGSD